MNARHPYVKYNRQHSPKEHSWTYAESEAAPLLSVIICTYNRRNMLLAALASLRKQTLPYEQFEIIVIDNGSSDSTISAVEAYVYADSLQRKVAGKAWQVFCRLETRNGLVYARNTGLAMARSNIAVFIDDDTYVEAHFLEHLLDAYTETGADAVGSCVEIHWDGHRPYWLTEDLLPLLGYFSPCAVRIPLSEPISFSSSCFSVKIDVLQQVGGFIPFLSKRSSVPMNMEIAELCQRLRTAGCILWYEPNARVFHCISCKRLQRAFLVGRSYWQGRSEILVEYAQIERHKTVEQASLRQLLRHIYPEVRYFAQMFLLHRPLLGLAHCSMREKLRATMSRAHQWGRLRQQFLLLNHVPSLSEKPSILLLRADEHDATYLVKALLALRIHCTTSSHYLSLSWLWRHRRCQGQTLGIVHLYRPGAFNLNHWQRKWLLLRLGIAQLLGICIVTTDAGGWWQNVSGWQFLARRMFEKKIFLYSHIVHSYTHHPEQLYSDQKLRQRVHCLPHPGLYDSLAEPVARKQAYRQLGLPQRTTFVYICLAYLHTEREIISLIEAFAELKSGLYQHQTDEVPMPRLLLVGSPRDKKQTARVLQLAALNSAIHLSLEYCPADMPLYIGASHALVMPHFALKTAGIVDIAILFYSYERIIIAPNLPRFQELLPAYASILYDPANQTTLVQAMQTALTQQYHHKEQEASALHVENSWKQYARRLLDMYQPLLTRKASS